MKQKTPRGRDQRGPSTQKAKSSKSSSEGQGRTGGKRAKPFSKGETRNQKPHARAAVKSESRGDKADRFAGKSERRGKAGPSAGKTEGGARSSSRFGSKSERGERGQGRFAEKSERGERGQGRLFGKSERGERGQGRLFGKSERGERGQGRLFGQSERRSVEGLREGDFENESSYQRPTKWRHYRSAADIVRKPSELIPGTWIFATRVGSESDLVDELDALKVKFLPTVLAPGLVLAKEVPKRDKRPVELTFARQGFPIALVATGYDLAEQVEKLAPVLLSRLEGKTEYALHTWVSDSPEGNLLTSLSDDLDQALETKFRELAPSLTRVDDAALRRTSGLAFVQVCVIDAERLAGGVCYANQAISLARGGRTRVRVAGELPSRAARKIEEAFAWLGVAPGAGEVCVDLGAAPGGWTYVLSERRAKVIAVDPANLRPDIAAKRNVKHVQDNAFTYQPDEPVDWLFCDMAYRPLEVAALLAKWGRRRWTRMLVANIKLPMKKKVEILGRVKQILHDEGSFKHIRARQLYHDRDEITLSAHVG